MGPCSSLSSDGYRYFVIFVDAYTKYAWYQSLDEQAVTSLNLTILIYLIKIKHNVMWVCASFKSKRLSLEGVC
jgi:hypothetical protein